QLLEQAFAPLRRQRQQLGSCGVIRTWSTPHHDGLALFTPGQVFRGEVFEVAAVRQQALDAAYAAHPERFVKGPPTVALPPAQVLINPADAAPPSGGDLLDTADDKVDELWPAKDNERVPTINLPGAPPPQAAAL